jgi:MoaA/NifB/PqqE/SkfB family radical SAM enzyme
MDVQTADQGPRSAGSFEEAQRLSSRRLGFSVTKACPLRCAHCSVSAAPELGSTTFSKAFGQRVAAQMAGLAAIGIRFIDFTGGEPTLASDFVTTVSSAARDSGMSCGIVTAAHWAATPANARRFIRRFHDITNWDISTDVYHLPFVSLETVRLAWEELSAAGRTPLIRIAHHDPITHADAVLIDAVHRFAGRKIAFQPIGPVGRGSDLLHYIATPERDADRSPCPSTGPLVQPGGEVAPCCAPLSHEEYDHPLRLGNAFREPLAEIVTRWRVHPLLQTLRVWGFGPVFEWLAAEGGAFGHILRHRICHECVELVRDRRLCEVAMRRASEIEHRIRLAYALKQDFGEPWMDEALMREAACELAGAY